MNLPTVNQQQKLIEILHKGFLIGAIAVSVIPFLDIVKPPEKPSEEIVKWVLIGMGAVQIIIARSIEPFIAKLPSLSGQSISHRKFTAKIISFALHEAAAIMSFVAYFLSGDINNTAFLSAAAIISLLLLKPKESS